MRYINGVIGVVLAVLAALQFAFAAPMVWVPIYGAGSVLAFATLSPLPCWSVRVLAIATTGAMFFYFAGFFRMAPELPSDWYWHALDAWSLLFAAFAMIPVLSEFSCRMPEKGGEPVAKDGKTTFSFNRPPAPQPPQTSTPPASPNALD